MTYVWLTLGIGGVALQFVVIYFMTKGFHRRFPWVFLYLIVLLLTGISDFAGAIDPDSYETWYRSVYYTNNTVRQVAGFLAVVSLYIYATGEHPERARIRTWVLIAAFGMMGLAAAIGYAVTGGGSYYLVEFYRDSSFITALLNIGLWFGLVKRRVTDRALLMVSGGLGVNMAGEAIAQALIGMSAGDVVVNLANLIGVTSHLLCLYIWLVALRHSIRESKTAPETAQIPHANGGES